MKKEQKPEIELTDEELKVLQVKKLEERKNRCLARINQVLEEEKFIPDFSTVIRSNGRIETIFDLVSR